MAHVVHAPQVSVASVLALASALKKPEAHVSHTRLLLAVAAVLVKLPAEHTSLTMVHAAPLSSVENDVPATHAAHWRSAVLEPAADCPWPTGHVAHAAQAPLPPRP